MNKKQPNILWICKDQQRFDTLSCYGNEFVETLNLDRLAQEGMLFENAYSQSPVCTPSRASFLTGRYPSTTRCRQNGADIPEDEVLSQKVEKRHATKKRVGKSSNFRKFRSKGSASERDGWEGRGSRSEGRQSGFAKQRATTRNTQHEKICKHRNHRKKRLNTEIHRR